MLRIRSLRDLKLWGWYFVHSRPTAMENIYRLLGKNGPEYSHFWHDATEFYGSLDVKGKNPAETTRLVSSAFTCSLS